MLCSGATTLLSFRAQRESSGARQPGHQASPEGASKPHIAQLTWRVRSLAGAANEPATTQFRSFRSFASERTWERSCASQAGSAGRRGICQPETPRAKHSFVRNGIPKRSLGTRGAERFMPYKKTRERVMSLRMTSLYRLSLPRFVIRN
jgi:hypothetical protein